jgi:hypothetical protein
MDTDLTARDARRILWHLHSRFSSFWLLCGAAAGGAAALAATVLLFQLTSWPFDGVKALVATGVVVAGSIGGIITALLQVTAHQMNVATQLSDYVDNSVDQRGRCHPDATDTMTYLITHRQQIPTYTRLLPRLLPTITYTHQLRREPTPVSSATLLPDRSPTIPAHQPAADSTIRTLLQHRDLSLLHPAALQHQLNRTNSTPVDTIWTQVAADISALGDTARLADILAGDLLDTAGLRAGTINDTQLQQLTDTDAWSHVTSTAAALTPTT